MRPRGLVRLGAGTALPQRGPLEITVLFPAGSSADVTARMLADGMSRQLNQRVLVVNRPGAGGAIGYKYVQAQKPDGYSLVWNSNSISTTYHSGQLGFDYQAFDAVARVLVESVVLAGEKRLALAHAAGFRPRCEVEAQGPERRPLRHRQPYPHLARRARQQGRHRVNESAVRRRASRAEPARRARRRGGAAPAALAAPVKQGQVRLLAALIPNRDPALPDVATAKEQGIDVSLEAWRGIAVPRGTPRAAISQLESAIRNTVGSVEFVKGSENLGVRPAFMPADEFGALIAKEDAELARLMQGIGLKK
jgi:tripartite-type tricarboxylate transporter receptor subunit TctC